MDERKIKCRLTFTLTQVKNLAEFLELNFIQSIRDDTDIDNIDYLCDMCGIYKELKKIAGEGDCD